MSDNQSKIRRYYAACARERDELRELNAELLTALKCWSTMARCNDTYWSNILNQTATAIANAEKLK